MTPTCRSPSGPGASSLVSCFLGETLHTDHIKADYDANVRTVRIPMAERAKPRKIAIGGGAERREINA